MWNRKCKGIKRIRRFFLINLSHDNLENFYNTNYQLLQNFNYSLSDLDSMVPWEREIYLAMLINDLKEKEHQAQQRG